MKNNAKQTLRLRFGRVLGALRLIVRGASVDKHWASVDKHWMGA